MKSALICLLVGTLALAVPAAESGSDSAASLEFGEPRNRYSTETRGRRSRDAQPLYAVASVSLTNGRWAAVRYHRRTGQCWQLQEGHWEPIREVQQLAPDQPSSFEVQVMNSSPGRFSAIRLDQQSGQCWELVENLWEPIMDLQQ